MPRKSKGRPRRERGARALSRQVGIGRPGPQRRRAVAGESTDDGFFAELRAAGLPWRVFTLLAVHLSETLLLLGSWACVGLGALTGRLDAGWLAAWALALGSTVPLHAASTWLQGTVALGFVGLLKQRLLVGAMKASPPWILRTTASACSAFCGVRRR